MHARAGCCGSGHGANACHAGGGAGIGQGAGFFALALAAQAFGAFDVVGHFMRHHPARALDHAPGAIEAAAPVTGVQAGDFDVLAGARGVDKAAIAQIQPVVRVIEATGVEEQHVAGLELVAADRAAHLGLFGRRARQVDAGGLEDIADKATAIKAVYRGIAAKAVGNAHQADGLQDHIAYRAFASRRGVRDIGGFAGGFAVIAWRRVGVWQQQGAEQG